MARRIISVIAGVTTAVVLLMLLEMLGQLLYPPPAELNQQNRDAMRAYMESMPAGAYFTLLVMYAISSFAGGLVSSLVGGRQSSRYAIITGCIMVVFGIMSMAMIPGQPIWFIILGTLVFLPFAYLGYVAVMSKRPLP